MFSIVAKAQLAILLLAMQATTARAEYVHLSLAELVRQSKLIVIGEVIHVRPITQRDMGFSFEAIFAPQEFIKGQKPKTQIKVLFQSGFVCDTVVLHAGHRYLLFLTKPHGVRSADVWTVHNYSNGVAHINQHEFVLGSIVPDHNRWPFIGMSLGDFRKEIESRLKD